MPTRGRKCRQEADKENNTSNNIPELRHIQTSTAPTNAWRMPTPLFCAPRWMPLSVSWRWAIGTATSNMAVYLTNTMALTTRRVFKSTQATWCTRRRSRSSRRTLVQMKSKKMRILRQPPPILEPLALAFRHPSSSLVLLLQTVLLQSFSLEVFPTVHFRVQQSLQIQGCLYSNNACTHLACNWLATDWTNR